MFIEVSGTIINTDKIVYINKGYGQVYFSEDFFITLVYSDIEVLDHTLLMMYRKEQRRIK